MLADTAADLVADLDVEPVEPVVAHAAAVHAAVVVRAATLAVIPVHLAMHLASSSVVPVDL